MKKQIYVSLLLYILAAAVNPVFAQEKVIEKSAGKRPVWVNNTAQEYIITSAIADDLEKAKGQVLEDVRKQIIRAVAENVTLTSTGMTQQKIENNEITHFVDNFSSNYQTQSASIPFVTGVSASKITDSYWEKRRDKKTKEISYLYAIKYPLPEIELKKMIRDFEKLDHEMYARYAALEDKIEAIESLEDIDNSISALNPLIGYFFDDTRKNAAKTLQQRYRDLYKNISFRTVSNKLGDYRFSLMLNGKPVSTSQRMTASSDGAYDMNIESNEKVVFVKYRFDGAEFDIPNEITVNTRIGGKSVPHKFTFTVRKMGIKLYPEKTVYLTAATRNDSIVGHIGIRIPIKSEYTSSYIVRSLTLEVPGLADPIFMDSLDVTSNRKQEIIKLEYEGDIELLEKLNGLMNMVKGSIEVEIPEEQIDTRIDFALPVKTNW